MHSNTKGLVCPFWDRGSGSATKPQKSRPALLQDCSNIAQSFKKRILWLVPILFGESRKRCFPNLRFVQILGTNGKGSFCKELYTQLSDCYPAVFTFISPHLKDLRERFLLNGKKLPVHAYSSWQKTYGDYFPNFFEKILAFSLYQVAYGGHFDPVAPAVVILEAGLGGRFDATSSLEIDYSVLLDVGADHQEMLGFAHFQRVREKTMALSPHTKAVFCSKRLARTPSWDQELYSMPVVVGSQVDKLKGLPECSSLPEFPQLPERSFAQQWSAFLGVPVTEIELTVDRESLSKAASKVCSALLQDMLPVFSEEMKETFELKARQNKETPMLKHTIFDVAHNSCALSFMIDRLKTQNKAKSNWLVLSLEASRLRHTDWVQLLNFYEVVIGVEISPSLGALGKTPDFPSCLEDGRGLIRRASSAKYIEVSYDPQKDVCHINRQYGGSNDCLKALFPIFPSKKVKSYQSLEFFLRDLEEKAQSSGAQLVVAGSFYWMQEVFTKLKI